MSIESDAANAFGRLQVLQGTRADYSPRDGLNISMDFNAAPSGQARGTEVIIPDNAPPELRAAAQRFNQMVVDFASSNGIEGYRDRGVRTTSENGRGVQNTVHVEPFFNSDQEMQELIRQNPRAFANIYRDAFGNIDGRLIAPHGVGGDRGAASDVFGDETSYGELMINALLGQSRGRQPNGPPRQSQGNAMSNALSNAPAQPQGQAPQPLQWQNALAGPMQPQGAPMAPHPASAPQRQPLQWQLMNPQDFAIF